jgi:hypothetical protein
MAMGELFGYALADIQHSVVERTYLCTAAYIRQANATPSMRLPSARVSLHSCQCHVKNQSEKYL